MSSRSVLAPIALGTLSGLATIALLLLGALSVATFAAMATVTIFFVSIFRPPDRSLVIEVTDKAVIIRRGTRHAHDESGGTRLCRAAIEQIYVAARADSDGAVFRVCVLLRSGERHVLVDRVEGLSRARGIEQSIENRLGLIDAPVSEPATEGRRGGRASWCPGLPRCCTSPDRCG